MAKIGIITFHCANNYGAVLQAYGLQEYLRSQGHESYIINYKPKFIIQMYANFSIYHWISRNPWKCLERMAQEVRIKPMRIKRWCVFENFRKNHLMLYPYKKNYDYSFFDAIILGSDQIWNSNMVGGRMDDMFWGKGFNCKVIAYAASTRKFDYTPNELQYIKESLSRLSSIGVREESLKRYIQPLSSKKISVVLDPSLLAGYEVFKKIAKSPKETNYLLVYEIGRQRKTRQIATFIAKQLGLKIVELVNNPIEPEASLNQTASPEEFVGYFENASFVVTTSFHGIAFSYLFKRNFIAIKQNTSADDRIDSFLNEIGLTSQFVKDENEVSDRNLKINYDISCNDYLFQLNKSKAFIDEAINN